MLLAHTGRIYTLVWWFLGTLSTLHAPVMQKVCHALHVALLLLLPASLADMQSWHCGDRMGYLLTNKELCTDSCLCGLPLPSVHRLALLLL